MNRASAAFLGLVCSVLLGAESVPEVVTFPEEAAPVVGDAWVESARWHRTGRTRVQVGPAVVRDREADDGVLYTTSVQVTGVEEGRISEVELAFSSARRLEGDEEKGVELDGVAVVGRGLRERKWRTVAGKRLRKKPRKFLQERFGGDPEGDPVRLLLPPGPVAVGDAWDIDMESVIDQLGRDRFELDTDRSRARASLESVVERRGVRFARVPFDVAIVPASIKGGEYTEAWMKLSGAAEFPLSPGHPGRVLEVDLRTRYDGTFKRGAVKAVIDFDLRSVGREERR